MLPATLLQSLVPLAGLDVTVSAEGATTIIALRGEADAATLSQIAEAFAHVVRDGAGDVVVDLAETEFIDTATVRAVLQARETLADRGRKITLRSPSRVAERMLAIFGLSHLVSPAPTARR